MENHIEELLYRYNCVVVPEFGAFLSQMKSAVLDRPSNTFYPPTKILSFNEQLASNDGLLVSHMANAEEKTYEETLKNTLENSRMWKKQLLQGQRLSLPNIGELWLNREGKIQFQPANQVNYLTAAFGLSAVVSPRVAREVLKEEVEQLEERIPFIITPETRKRVNFRPYLKYAAILLLAFSTGLTGYRLYDESLSTGRLARQDAQELVVRNIHEATFFNSKPLELPALKLEFSKKASGGRHHVIAGAFRIRQNADKKVRQLQSRGYDASYIGMNTYGLHQVTYGSFDDPEEALAFLKKIKQTDSRDAWLLSSR